MKMLSLFYAAALAALLIVPTGRAQEAPKPGPEHDVLKKMEGKWDLTMKAGGADNKGSVSWKMELGGMWLTGNLESEMFGTKFTGKSLDTYDTAKKKYISVWVDSMSTSPMLMEGTYDKEKKTMTMAGDGPGMDGKPTKHKTVSEMKDDDTVHFSMYMGDGKEPAFTIVYKRKK